MAENSDRTRPSSNGPDDTVYGDNENTVPHGDPERTVYAETQFATVYAGDQKTKLLKEIENRVSFDWHAGDVILDLYEVLPVNEEGASYHEGGFGKVYKVRHKTWGIDLAVKTPHENAFATEAQKQDFIGECRLWIELGMHVHIATCYYVRELGGVPRIFAEYVRGGSLKEWIRSKRIYEGGKERALKRILNIAIQFAWGLHYAHEKGMIHQDVKPRNAMMTENGEVKVVDFGLASAVAVKSGPARFYTPAYCSPEQAGGKPLKRQTDIWSWGVSVLEMFAGEVTWQSGAIASYALESFLENNDGKSDMPVMPEAVALLLKCCFAEDEERRPQTMIDAADRLIEVYQSECKEEYPRVWEEGASGTPDALNNYALSYIDLGDNKKAETTWDKALEINAQHLLSAYNRGLLLWRTGRITDLTLITQINNIKANESELWLLYYLSGMIHIERSAADSAIDMLKKAAQRKADDPEINDALKTAQKGKGRWCRHIRSIEARHTSEIAISKDGKYILTGGHSDESLHLRETSLGQHIRTFGGHEGGIDALSISVNGRYLISGSYEGLVKVWEFPSGKCIDAWSHRGFGAHASVTAAAVTSDGKQAISGGSDNSIELRDLSTDRTTDFFTGHSGYISSLVISTDDKYLVSGSGDGTIKLWDIRERKCIRTLPGHEYGTNCVAVTKDLKYILSGGSDRKLKLWDVRTGECLRTFISHRYTVSALALTADDRYVLSGESQIQYDDINMLKMFDISTGQCLRSFGGTRKYMVHAITTSRDGHYAATSSIGAKTVELWNTDNSNELAKWHLSRPERVTEITQREAQLKRLIHESEKMKDQGRYIDAAKLLLQAQMLPGGQRFNELLDAWADIYRVLPKYGFKNAWEVGDIEGFDHIAFSVMKREDGSYIKSEKNDRTHDILDIMTSTLGNDIFINQPHADLLFIDSNGKYAISKFSEDTLKLWELSSGRCRHVLKGKKHNISVVKISPYERYLLVGSQPYNEKTCALQLFELSTGKHLKTFKINGRVRAAAVSIDGKYMIAGNLSGGQSLFGDSDSPASYWDISSGKCLKTFAGHTNHINAIDASGDGRFFISSSADRTIRYWDIQTGKCLQTFIGHSDGVLSAVLSADKRYILSGGHDKLVKLWEVKTGKCLHTFEGHKKSVYSIVLSADSRYAVSKSVDGETKLWEITWIVQAREQAGWHDGAMPYLQNFLKLHQPYNGKSKAPKHREWTEEEFGQLMTELGYRGYGWLRPEGVRAKLEEMSGG